MWAIGQRATGTYHLLEGHKAATFRFVRPKVTPDATLCDNPILSKILPQLILRVLSMKSAHVQPHQRLRHGGVGVYGSGGVPASMYT